MIGRMVQGYSIILLDEILTILGVIAYLFEAFTVNFLEYMSISKY